MCVYNSHKFPTLCMQRNADVGSLFATPVPSGGGGSLVFRIFLAPEIEKTYKTPCCQNFCVQECRKVYKTISFLAFCAPEFKKACKPPCIQNVFVPECRKLSKPAVFKSFLCSRSQKIYPKPMFSKDFCIPECRKVIKKFFDFFGFQNSKKLRKTASFDILVF